MDHFVARDRELVVCRMICLLGKRPTLEALGARFGVTRERIRQLEVQIEKRLNGLLRQPSAAPLVLLARRWRSLLGVAAPFDAGLAQLDSFGKRALTRGFDCETADIATIAFLLAMRLAGPYRGTRRLAAASLRVARHGGLPARSPADSDANRPGADH